ncbi:MAG TPA: M1 family aminopeptidase, partial [Sphingomicrobium sp.]|nr:M1 family aminopeptidase [Sphingomicrobium sp.]
MNPWTRSALAAAMILTASCRVAEQDDPAPPAAREAAAIAPVLATPDARDVHSFARPLEARVHHVALDLSVDFDSRRVGGTATLDIERKPGAKEIVLDDKGLEIAAVTDGAGRPLAWKVGAADPALGAPLTIALGPDTRRIAIRYKSAPNAEALQWLTPEQTAGKKKPYLFSQGQAILNRSWIPTQDSPGIRQSWEATIRVPAGLTAVMSAPRAAEPITQGGESLFQFRMPNSVAPYLIAIVVGDLAFEPLGPRSGVWTEPAMLAAAAAELADTEKMIAAAERLYGPYRWGRYDMVVLPPSFPFGGMENPTLTFLTP